MAHSSGKILSLQGLRALAFLGIFGTHLTIICNMGGWGVSIFVVMSGFLMALAYNQKMDSFNVSFKENVRFGIKKMKKLYPLHIIMLCVAIVFWIIRVVTHTRTYDLVKDPIALIANVFLVQALIPVDGIYISFNPLSWYLSVSMFLYMIFPWIIKIIKKKNIKTLIVYSLLIYVVMWVWTIFACKYLRNYPSYLNYVAYVNPLLRLGDFSVGAIFGYIFLNRENNISFKTASVLEIITVALIAITIWLANNNWDGEIAFLLHQSPVVFLPTSVVIVYLLTINKGIISNVLSLKPFVYIGDMSPYGYLVHQLVIVLTSTFCTYIFNYSINKYLLTGISVTLTWIAIYIYLFIEKKLFSNKKKSN